MADVKQCPLKVASPKKIKDTTCKPDCAWFHEGTHKCVMQYLVQYLPGK